MPNGRFRPLAKTSIRSGLPSLGDSAKHLDLARAAFGHEDVAVRGGANQARVVEPAGVEPHAEAGGGLRPCVGRARDDSGSVAGGVGGVRLGQILHGDLVDPAGLLKAVVGERRAWEAADPRASAGRRRRPRASPAAIGAPPSDLRKETICQRCCSGRLDQAGMPLLTSPLVMYQKSSPSVAPWIAPLVMGGTLPVPAPVTPWQAAQYCA